MAASDPSEVLLLPGELLHPAVRSSTLPGRGVGYVATSAIPPAALLLRTRGFDFPPAAAEDGTFLARVLATAASLPADERAVLLQRCDTLLCPRTLTEEHVAPLRGQLPQLARISRHFAAHAGLEMSAERLLALIVRFGRNALADGVFPLAALFKQVAHTHKPFRRRCWQ